MNNFNAEISTSLTDLNNFIQRGETHFRTVRVVETDQFYENNRNVIPVSLSRSSSARYLRQVLHNCKWVKTNSDLEKITEIIAGLNLKGDAGYDTYNHTMAVALATSLRDSGKGIFTYVSPCGASFYSIILEQVNDFYRPIELLFYTKPPVIQIKEK